MAQILRGRSQQNAFCLPNGGPSCTWHADVWPLECVRQSRRQPFRNGSAAPVWARNDFEQVLIRVCEIEAAPAVIVIYLVGFRSSWVCPIRQTTRSDASEHGIKTLVVSAKRVAERTLSAHQTIVWFNCTPIWTSLRPCNQVRCANCT